MTLVKSGNHVGDIGRLPKWAQEYISGKERTIDWLMKELREVEKRIGLDDEGFLRVPEGQRIRWNRSNHFEDATAQFNSDGSLEVYLSRMVIQPHVSNHVTLRSFR